MTDEERRLRAVAALDADRTIREALEAAGLAWGPVTGSGRVWLRDEAGCDRAHWTAGEVVAWAHRWEDPYEVPTLDPCECEA